MRISVADWNLKGKVLCARHKVPLPAIEDIKKDQGGMIQFEEFCRWSITPGVGSRSKKGMDSIEECESKSNSSLGTTPKNKKRPKSQERKVLSDGEKESNNKYRTIKVMSKQDLIVKSVDAKDFSPVLSPTESKQISRTTSDKGPQAESKKKLRPAFSD